jgi:hypothetical protein
LQNLINSARVREIFMKLLPIPIITHKFEMLNFSMLPA